MTPNRHRFEDVFEYIEAFLAAHGYPPTIRQIADGVGYASASSAHNAVWALIAEGRLSGSPGRTLRISA